MDETVSWTRYCVSEIIFYRQIKIFEKRTITFSITLQIVQIGIANWKYTNGNTPILHKTPIYRKKHFYARMRSVHSSFL